MNETINVSAETTFPRIVSLDIDSVLAALEEARATELAAHRKLILSDGLTTKKRNKDPDHTFLAGHTGGYLIGIAKAVEILNAAKSGYETQPASIQTPPETAQI